jgi:hypothetical protein
MEAAALALTPLSLPFLSRHLVMAAATLDNGGEGSAVTLLAAALSGGHHRIWRLHLYPASASTC